MADLNLVIEDGSVVSNANSYYTLASADDYFELRGETTWLGYDDDDKTHAMIKACQYMENLSWKGVKSESDQELSWPRIGMTDSSNYAVDSDEIPRDVKWGQAEIAYRYILDTDIEPDIAAGSGNIVSEKIDVIEIHYTRSGKSVNKIYQRVNNILSPFLKYGGGGCVIEVIRG